LRTSPCIALWSFVNIYLFRITNIYFFIFRIYIASRTLLERAICIILQFVFFNILLLIVIILGFIICILIIFQNFWWILIFLLLIHERIKTEQRSPWRKFSINPLTCLLLLRAGLFWNFMVIPWIACSLKTFFCSLLIWNHLILTCLIISYEDQLGCNYFRSSLYS